MSQQLPKMNYTGNSNKARLHTVEETAEPEKKKVIPKIEGISASQRKKSIGKRLGEMFSPTDLKAIGAVIFTTIVIPAAKDMLFDALKEGGSRAIYGEGSSRRTTSGNGPIGNVRKQQNYGSIFRSASTIGQQIREEETRHISNRARSTHDFSNEIVIKDRADAEQTILNLMELIDQYGWATVADLYEMVQIVGDFPDNRFGWDDLSRARVVHTRDGYILDLPPTKEIP